MTTFSLCIWFDYALGSYTTLYVMLILFVYMHAIFNNTFQPKNKKHYGNCTSVFRNSFGVKLSLVTSGTPASVQLFVWLCKWHLD